MKTTYYDQKIECMAENELSELQLKLFNRQLKRAGKTVAYKGKLPSKIHDLSEIKNIPFTTKEDLRQNFPYGFLAVSKEKIVRFNTTSGTTGIPTLAYFTKKDIEHATNRAIRHFFMAGLTPKSMVQSMLGNSLFVGGWYHHNAAFKMGMTVLPTGLGNTERQITLLKQLKPKFCFSTSAYFLHVLQALSEEDINKISLKTCIIGSEPTSSEAKKIVKEKYHIDLYDLYGFTEAGGPFAQDCPYHTGLHIPEDHIYAEIINPDTGEVLPDGEYGELVITPLRQEAMPLIRYRTRDITRILTGKCPCGRTHKRIEAVTHRIDDMIIINGVNIFPSQIEECIYHILPYCTNYQIEVKEKQSLKKLKLIIELSDDIRLNQGKSEILKTNLISLLRSYITITPLIDFVPLCSLPEINGKAKRVKFLKE